MNMGERLKELRLQKKATQEDIGKIINVSKATIMKYEKGLVENLKRSSIEKLAKYFDVAPSYLMCLDDETSLKNNHTNINEEIKLLYGENYTQLLENYNKLNDLGKQTINIYIEGLTEVPKFTEKDEKKDINKKTGLQDA